ncbi:membrane-spanning 4-domains subfamily A member 8 isoform X2 [Trachypithecus francoisi]|uniref:membrane-spanning 4-domains subfamily A member 8 isoform X2 n=1 Tax=Trachypithecus francoisi TaxID=54180 RepID=UPI00141AF102|nr:membrane-spanning 4-domains subfamily A member 8 isoform X2 [Trachypithecus francoisi]
MNSMTSAVPVANSVLVVAPHNGYPVTPGIMSQVPLYPNNQPQVHLVPGNPPGLVSNVNSQPVQKTLKEGKTLGFIISGSLSVTAENQPHSHCLLSGSLGLNIVSAICSAVGVILFITDLSIPQPYAYTNYYTYAWGVNPGLAISGVLLVFCLLEFGIACASSHFGCQLVCCQSSNVSVVYPNVYAANPVVIPEPVTSPPSYSSEIQANK